MKPHVLYLHGFGSGPLSAKGLAIKRRLQGHIASFTIPDLEEGDFFNLTMMLLWERALAAIARVPPDGAPLVIIGSSLGGYTAAWLAASGQLSNRVTGMLLIAPAFKFTTRWTTLLGEDGIVAWRSEGRRSFFHHGRARDEWLSSAFLDSCEGLPEIPGPPPVPTVIVHGQQDETIDWRHSRAYADQMGPIELYLVDGDHRLTDLCHEELIICRAMGLIKNCKV